MVILICISLTWRHWAYFHIPFSYVNLFVWKMLIQALGPTVNLVVFFVFWNRISSSPGLELLNSLCNWGQLWGPSSLVLASHVAGATGWSNRRGGGWLFVSCTLSYLSFLYVWAINPLSEVWLANALPSWEVSSFLISLLHTQAF